MTDKSATELRKEIREGYDEYMRNHYAKIQIDYFLSGLPVKPEPVKHFFLEAGQSAAVTQSAHLKMRTVLFIVQSMTTDDILHTTINTESIIDRMVREAKSRLAVSIEANANYELIQMKKSWIQRQRYNEFVEAQLRQLADALGVTYHSLTGLDYKSARSKMFGPLGKAWIDPVVDDSIPLMQPRSTRSYKMPEKASKFGRWVDDTTTPGQMVWQDDRPDLATPHPLLESVQSYWQRLKQKLDSCY